MSAAFPLASRPRSCRIASSTRGSDDGRGASTGAYRRCRLSSPRSNPSTLSAPATPWMFGTARPDSHADTADCVVFSRFARSICVMPRRTRASFTARPNGNSSRFGSLIVADGTSPSSPMFLAGAARPSTVIPPGGEGWTGSTGPTTTQPTTAERNREAPSTVATSVAPVEPLLRR